MPYYYCSNPMCSVYILGSSCEGLCTCGSFAVAYNDEDSERLNRAIWFSRV